MLLLVTASVADAKGVARVFGSGDFGTNSPRGVAVDQASGDVYVVDGGGNRILRYDAEGVAQGPAVSGAGNGAGQLTTPSGVAVAGDGTMWVSDAGSLRLQRFAALDVFGMHPFDRAVGWDVTDPATVPAEFEVCSGGDACKAGVAGNGGGQFGGTATTFTGQLALDGAGKLWAADPINRRLQRFDAGTGAFEAAFGNATVFGNASPTRMAVDSVGALYVVDTGGNRVQKCFVVAGPPESLSCSAFAANQLSGFFPFAVAVANDRVYVARRATTASSEILVSELLPNGNLVTNHGVGAGLVTSAAFANAHAALAVNAASGDIYLTMPQSTASARVVYVLADVANPTASIPVVSGVTATAATLDGTVNPNAVSGANVPEARYRFEYKPASAANWSRVPAVDGTVPNATTPQSLASEALTGLAPNTQYQTRIVATKPNAAGTHTSPLANFTTDAIVPGVTGLASYEVADVSAGVRGRVNPNNAATTYHFEYGTDPGLAGASQTPAQSAGDGGAASSVSAFLEGLAPNTTYYYRLVAENPTGQSSTPIDVFATGSEPLPGSPYVYEKVSPADKGNGEVAGGSLTSAMRASDSGERVLYGADGAFLGAPGFPQFNAYFADRGADSWNNKSVSAQLPYTPALSIFDPIGGQTIPTGLSADGRKTVIGTNLDPGTGDSMPRAIYLVDLVAGTHERISPPPVAGSPDAFLGNGNLPSRVAGSDDFSTVYYSATAELTSEAVAPGIPADSEKLYRFSDGETTLASWDENGNPIAGVLVDTRTDPVGPNSVSRDGSVYWFAAQPGTSGYDLYRGRAGEERSTLLNTPEGVVGAPLPIAQLAGASSDGERAIFSTNQGLLPDATDGSASLYLYTHSDDPANDDNLTLLSVDNEPADGTSSAIGRVLAVSDDADTAYFTSTQQLVSGAPTGPGEKMYRWNDGGLEYLFHAGAASTKVSTTSPDGRYFLFASGNDLTPDDAGGVQAYLYDADVGEVRCASCLPGGANVASVGLNRTVVSFLTVTSEPRRWLSDDGRVFFDTTDALLRRDVNGRQDIYTWKDGRLDLVSSGRGTSDARFADAGADGRTVLFVTRERLTEWDTDLRADLYAARIGGGHPGPTIRSGDGCAGGDCQGPSAPRPNSPELGSLALAGAGNPRSASTCARFSARIRATRRQARQLRSRARVAQRRARSPRVAPRRARVLRVRSVRLRRLASKRLARVVVIQGQQRACKGGDR